MKKLSLQQETNLIKPKYKSMQRTKFYNSQRLWSILVMLCLLAPLQLTAQTTLIFKDSVGTGIDGNGNGELNFPQEILVNSDGSFLVADNGNHRVQKFDKNGNYVSQFGGSGKTDGKFNGPNGIAQDSKGNLFITDRYNNRVQKFDKDGNFIKVIGTTTASTANGDFSNPVGIVVDAADNVYVVDRNNDRVQKFTNDGVFIKVIGGAGTTDGLFKSPYGIIVDSDANIYVTDLTRDNVQKFDSTGKFLSSFGGTGTGDGKLSNPQGIAFDLQGNIYISDSGTDSIQVFNNVGTFVKKYKPAHGKTIDFITFDSNGDLYATSGDYDRIYRFTTDKEINIKQGTTSVATGGTVDFGSVIVSQSKDNTFTLENTGGFDLTLKGTTGSQVAVSGTNASDFVVTQTSVTDAISGFSNVTFTVSYKPAGLGNSTAALTITSDDADEATYTINLTGTATSNVTGLDPDLKNGILKVGPVPANDHVNLSIEGRASNNISYQLVDMQGRNAAANGSGVAKNGALSIDLSQVRSGNYLLILQIGDERVVRRIQKK